MKTKNELLGIESLLLTTFIYSFFGILTRTIGFNLPLFFVCWTRSILSMMILGILILISKNWVQLKKKDIKWIVLRSIAGVFGFTSSFLAFYFIPIGTAYFISYGGMTISGYFLGKLIFNEKFTNIKIISLVLAIIGLVMIYSFNFNTEKFLYVFITLISGFATSIWYIFSKKVSSSYPALQLNFLDYIIFFLFTFFISLMLKEKWIMPSMNILWYANLGFTFMFLTTGQFIIYGFKHLEAQIGSLVMLTEVIFGIILGYLFYKETVSIYTLLGGLIIIFAIVLPELKIKFNK